MLRGLDVAVVTRHSLPQLLAADQTQARIVECAIRSEDVVDELYTVAHVERLAISSKEVLNRYPILEGDLHLTRVEHGRLGSSSASTVTPLPIRNLNEGQNEEDHEKRHEATLHVNLLSACRGSGWGGRHRPRAPARVCH